MGYASLPRRALALGCLLGVLILAGCGGDDSTADGDVQSVQVEASNTSAGRFPEEELVRAQEAAAAVEAELAAAAEAEAAAPEAGPASTPEPGAPREEGAAGATGIPAGEIEPGSYTSATFEPGFTLEVGVGWLSFQEELEDFVALSPADDLDLSVSFLSPNLSTALIDEEGEFIDQNPTDDQLLDPVAFDYFDWIHQHRRYEAGEIRSELLAGRAVSSFDATLTSGYLWQECLSECALLVATSDGELLAQEVGYRERLYTTKVADLTLIVSVAAPEEKFDAFVPRAVELLSTLEFVADAGEQAPVGESGPAATPPAEPATPPEPTAPPEPVAPPEPEKPEPPAEQDEVEEPERLPPAPLES